MCNTTGVVDVASRHRLDRCCPPSPDLPEVQRRSCSEINGEEQANGHDEYEPDLSFALYDLGPTTACRLSVCMCMPSKRSLR